MAEFEDQLAALVDLHQVVPKIGRRQAGCLRCEKVPLVCPPCSADQICHATLQTCNSCSQAICIAKSSDTEDLEGQNPPPPASSGPSSGAIAGGVVGGIAVIAVVTYLVWRFFIKTKRQSVSQLPYDDDTEEKLDSEKSTHPSRDHRSSTHTVHSIASTVLTRASNIIQIAYIPGVTNRATPTSPTLLVPPVPPIPMALSSSAANSPSPYQDQHFFVPGDLRDSTYSGLSDYTDRTSYARTSYAPRSSIAPSIASTIYGKNAVVVAPAQTGRLAKAAVVSVKSAGPGSTGSSTPPVPSVDYEKYARPKSRDSTFSVGSTFLNNATTATATQAARAQVIRVGSGPKKVNVGASKLSAEPASVSSTPSTPASVTRGPTPARDSNSTTIVADSPVDQGPFSDPPESPTHRSASSLSAVIEEATRLAAQGPDRRSKRVSSAERERSPFSDEHATKD